MWNRGGGVSDKVYLSFATRDVMSVLECPDPPLLSISSISWMENSKGNVTQMLLLGITSQTLIVIILSDLNELLINMLKHKVDLVSILKIKDSF